jgi:hypothetical protein
VSVETAPKDQEGLLAPGKLARQHDSLGGQFTMKKTGTVAKLYVIRSLAFNYLIKWI